jgi:hypothetical protein
VIAQLFFPFLEHEGEHCSTWQAQHLSIFLN